MRTKASVLSAALGWVALALALAWVAVRSAGQAEAAVADMAKKQLGLDAAITAVQDRIVALVRSEEALRAALREAQERQTAASAARKAAARPNMATLLASNPKVHALYMRSFRANLTTQFQPLYHTLGFSPAQVEKFEDLMMEREEERMDLQAAAQAQGLAPSDPAMAALQQQQDDQLREAEVGLLGDAGYQQLQQFNRVQPLEGAVTQMVATYVAETSPLTALQREQLVDVLAKASSQYQSGGPADVLTIDRPTALAQANQFLAGTQYAALEVGTQMWQVGSLLKQFFQTQPPGK